MFTRGGLADADAGSSSGSDTSRLKPDAGKVLRSLVAVADTRWRLGGSRHPGTDCREGESDAPSGEDVMARSTVK